MLKVLPALLFTLMLSLTGFAQEEERNFRLYSDESSPEQRQPSADAPKPPCFAHNVSKGQSPISMPAPAIKINQPMF